MSFLNWKWFLPESWCSLSGQKLLPCHVITFYPFVYPDSPVSCLRSLLLVTSVVIVCLKTLVVQPVSLKPCFYEGPVTHFPTMIWKVSGQILSWPLLHAVAEWFYLFLLNTNVHNFECDAPLTSPVTTTTLMILITLTPQLNVTILTSSNPNQSGWLSAG